MAEPRPRAVVLLLGGTQTLAWASSYYLPAVLAAPMAGAFELRPSLVFAWFSGALVLSALLGPAVGRVIDARGGRGVLAASNIVLAAALVVLGVAPGPWVFGAGWVLLGVGMALGLYDAAFATLAGLYGSAARGRITGITLIAGFASTVGWPLTAALEEAIGWRGACLTWAALHGLVGLPLHGLLPRAPPPARPSAGPAPSAADRGTMGLLAVVFAGAWFVSGALAAHLPALLGAMGATPAEAIAAAALLGPAQVAARLAEAGLLLRVHPLWSARLATLGHPLGAAALVAWGGAPGAALFVVLHGMGNGLLTIARGTLPLALFGPAGYGARAGWIGAPARLLQAGAPFLFGLLLERSGAVAALALTAALSLVAMATLLVLRAKAA